MLGDVVVMSYGIMYKWDPSAPQRIRQRRDVYYKQKELILAGKRLLPATIAFDFDIQLRTSHLLQLFRDWTFSMILQKVVWNFLNDCKNPAILQLAPCSLLPNFKKVKLPSNKERSWWLEFDISPFQ